MTKETALNFANAIDTGMLLVQPMGIVVDDGVDKQIAETLRKYAAMVSLCEGRIEKLGKCDCYEKNKGVCPAMRGEEVNFNNCLDESCDRGSVIKVLKEVLAADITKEV